MNTRGDNNMTPLIIATKLQNIECVREMLTHPKIHINAMDNQGESALFKADDIQILNMLLSVPNIKLNIQNKKGETALMKAIYNKNIECIQTLISRSNIQINKYDKTGQTALTKAALLGNIDMVRLLLTCPNIDADINTQENHVAITKAATLISKPSHEHFLCTKELFPFTNNYGLHKHTCLKTMVMHAVYHKHAAFLKTLIQTVSVNTRSNTKTLLMLAAERCDNDCIRVLLDHPDIDKDARDKEGLTACMHALKSGNVDGVQLLIHGENINEQNNQGETALMLAIKTGCPEMIRLILSIPNLDINIQNNLDNTALICLLISRQQFNYYEHKLISIQLLEIDNINVNIRNTQGKTALIYAMQLLNDGKTKKHRLNPLSNYFIPECFVKDDCYFNMGKVILMLINKTNINIQMIDGDTALMLAIRCNYLYCTKHILKVPSVRIYLHNNKGETACDIAHQLYTSNIRNWFALDLLYKSRKKRETFHRLVINRIFNKKGLGPGVARGIGDIITNMGDI